MSRGGIASFPWNLALGESDGGCIEKSAYAPPSGTAIFFGDSGIPFRLAVNARCREGSSLGVEARDRNDMVVAPYTLQSCDAFTGDAARPTFTWNGSPELPGGGKWRKIRFVLRDAEIFSFALITEDSH